MKWNRLTKRVIGRARRAYLARRPRPNPGPYDGTDLSHQPAADLIRKVLMSERPAMIARLGAVELGALTNYRAIHRNVSVFRKVGDYVRGVSPAPWWEEGFLNPMMISAGFFPTDAAAMDRFSAMMIEDMALVDVLGSWLVEEQEFAGELRQAVKVRLRDLEPYYHRDPWTDALAGKTVLVVHPFVRTIASQYARRSSLFADSRVLPAFELKTIAAVQSIVGTRTEFATWFDALASMRDQISNTRFDIAIIGAGAYGFPLAAHVKRLGKKAIHLGGATQILFGIRGHRWDTHEFISKLYNDHWVRALAEETPADFRKMEGGAYW